MSLRGKSAPLRGSSRTVASNSLMTLTPHLRDCGSWADTAGPGQERS